MRHIVRLQKQVHIIHSRCNVRRTRYECDKTRPYPERRIEQKAKAERNRWNVQWTGRKVATAEADAY